MKFGKVSMEELTMDFYKNDSSVNAAVLCEYGVFDSKQFNFTWNIRYKIFSKEGLNSLIMAIPAESRNMIKGIVFNLEDGKIVESKLKKESVYEERVIGRYTRMRIAPPNARVGSVVDLKFTMRGLPSMWRFQKEIPVLWSEIVIPYTEYIVFNTRFIGFEPLHLTSKNRWVAKDMPAFYPEPFINSENNYMTTMFVELSEINFPGFHQRISSSWEDVSDHFYEHPRFGELLRGSDPYLNVISEEIKVWSSNETEKVENALMIVRKEVKWNKHQTWMPSGLLRDVYIKDKTGNSADMNFLFMKLLNNLDVEYYPMLISIRDEGMINTFFPSITRFNYVISYVKLGDRFYAIDAASKYYPYDMLNSSCLNTSGFVVRRENGEWVDIVPEKTENLIINCNLDMEDDGMISGSLLVQHGGYSLADFRAEQEDFITEEEYLEKFEQENPELMVMDYSVENLDQDFGDIKETFQVEMDVYMDQAGGTISLDPVVLQKMDQNPLKIEERLYPVDFGHGKNKMYVMSLSLPEGYVVEKLPESVRLVTPDKSASYQYRAVHSGNKIQVMYQFSIKKAVYRPDEYQELKSFYNVVVSKETEPIIIKKVQP